MGNTKQINIKSRTYYFFNDMINYFICYFIHYIYYNDIN